MQDSPEAPVQQLDFDEEIKNLYLSLKSATQTLNKHLLCELEGDRFKLFEVILAKCNQLIAKAKKAEKIEILEKLEKFKREYSALMVTLGGLVKQAEMPRARFQKLLSTIKEL